MKGKSIKNGVAIVAKPSQPLALQLTREVIDWLVKRGLPFLLDNQTAESLGAISTTPKAVLGREQIAEHSDMIVVLGGDGTLISVARYPTSHSPIVIGVNMGTLGFLTSISPSEVFDSLEMVLSGAEMIEERPLLSASVVRDGKEESCYYAINDVVITKEALARIFGVEFYVDGEFAAPIRGDGVIVSTPCGSTAYSLSAGGSIVDPRVDAILVTPICPHSLTSRPLILPGSAKISLTLSPSSEEQLVYLTIDGQTGTRLLPGYVVEIGTSGHKVRFARSPSRSYFQALNTKLKWGSH